MQTATKIRWTVTAEHTQGKAVDHPCTKGIYTDHADSLDMIVEAEDWQDAEQLGRDELERMIAEAQPCDCRRREEAGSSAWWASVVIHVKPEFYGEHDTAQQVIAEARDGWDNYADSDITYAIKERFNCRQAGVADDGDVWIADPQARHWLSYEDMTDLVFWMHRQTML